MLRNPFRARLQIVALYLLCSSSVYAGDLNPDKSHLTSEVLLAEAALNAAVDSGDCRMEEVGDWQPILVSNGRIIESSAELRNVCTRMIDQRKKASYENESVIAKLLSSDAAIVFRQGTYRVESKAGKVTSAKIAMTSIWSLGGGNWTLIHLHESAIRPDQIE